MLLLSFFSIFDDSTVGPFVTIAATDTSLAATAAVTNAVTVAVGAVSPKATDVDNAAVSFDAHLCSSHEYCCSHVALTAGNTVILYDVVMLRQSNTWVT